MRRHFVTPAIAALAVLFLFTAAAAAQSPQPQESQSMKLLRLKSSQLSLDLKKADFDRYLKLKEEGLTSEADFAQRRTAYLQAQVDYQQALISFMGSEARISVASAVKFQDAGGKKFVRVTLRYSSKELKELAKLNISAEDLFPLDFMKEIKDVYCLPPVRGAKSFPIRMRRRSPRCPRIPAGRDVPASQGRREPGRERFFSGKNETTWVYARKASAPTS